jgi:hypothetical protein
MKYSEDHGRYYTESKSDILIGLGFIETSALDSTNVDQAFELILTGRQI